MCSLRRLLILLLFLVVICNIQPLGAQEETKTLRKVAAMLMLGGYQYFSEGNNNMALDSWEKALKSLRINLC